MKLCITSCGLQQQPVTGLDFGRNAACTAHHKLRSTANLHHCASYAIARLDCGHCAPSIVDFRLDSLWLEKTNTICARLSEHRRRVWQVYIDQRYYQLGVAARSGVLHSLVMWSVYIADLLFLQSSKERSLVDSFKMNHLEQCDHNSKSDILPAFRC